MTPVEMQEKALQIFIIRQKGPGKKHSRKISLSIKLMDVDKVQVC